MSSVIVFSKNRPMQLHAYIESLLRFSDATEKDISILYSCTDGISYDKVIETFKQVNWLKETNFYENLSGLIEKSSNMIMFGCDDVVFKNNFSLKNAEELLNQNEDIFGFSFRLGKNITPPPRKDFTNEKFIIWDWTQSDIEHYDYPWELCCTLYRKKDVQSIVKQVKKFVFNPNLLEEFLTINPEGYISRRKMACYNSDSKAFVITVNRVQDFAKSPFNGNFITEPAVLSRIYNEENVRLDIDKISALKNSKIHVGLEYFILTNGCVFKENAVVKYIKSAVKTIISVIDFLGEKIFKKKRFVLKLRRRIRGKILSVFSTYYYNKYKKLYPIVLSPQETLEKLKNHLTSFCRIGDGEIAIIMGNDIRFQKFHRRLAHNLAMIIHTKFDNILVGTNYTFFYANDNLLSSSYKYRKNAVPILRDEFLKIPRENNDFIDSEISLVYQTYKTYDFDYHYSTWKKIFAGRKILLVSGKGILDKLRYNLFEDAEIERLEHVYAPAKNAFSELARIIQEVQKYPADYVVCIILGPAAKPMVVDLTRRGYIACDIGHLLKDYDAYMKRTERSHKQSAEFFMPD